MSDYVEIDAIITDRWGNVESVYAGSQPAWAWEDDKCEAWRKMYRRELLSERTSDPRGWKVQFVESVT